MLFKSPTGIEYIITGLGNPGEKYRYNRHNAGFMCVDYISQKTGAKVNKIKFKSVCGETFINGHRVLLMKPQTFMNSSGEAVREAAAYYKIPLENIIVIFDDMAIEVGTTRIKRKGSDGGHNGIKSIIEHMSSNEFPRVKIGIGSPPPEIEVIHWVLGDIPKADRDLFFTTIEKSYEAAALMVDGNIDRAMNLYN